MHAPGYEIEMIFDREMAGVEPIHFRFGQVLEECFPSGRSKEHVVLPPEYDGLGLVLTKEGLPLRVQLDNSDAA